MKGFALSALAVVLVSLAACRGGAQTADGEPPSSTAGSTRVDPPAGPGAMAPRLTEAGDGVLLSWIEPAGDGHRLLVSRFAAAAGGWSAPSEALRGERVFANWADLPAVAAAADGTLVAHWLEKLGEGTYAYGVSLAISDDGGASWRRAGLLHDDASPNEHGFVSWVPRPDGALEAFWLDGRAMGGGGADDAGAGHGAAAAGPMQLRTTRLASDGTLAPSTLLDERTCECCATDAAATAEGPLVAYRDRSAEEVRDIALVRWTVDGWSEPTLLHRDGWRIEGCPVNGPAVATADSRVAVAWFTAADDRARVLAALSTDGGVSFSAPLMVDEERPLGRVDVAFAADGTPWVSWLAYPGPDAELRVRPLLPEGPGAPLAVATTTPSRSAGVPQLAAAGDGLLAVWVEDAEPRRLRGAQLASGR